MYTNTGYIYLLVAETACLLLGVPHVEGAAGGDGAETVAGGGGGEGEPSGLQRVSGGRDKTGQQEEERQPWW